MRPFDDDDDFVAPLEPVEEQLRSWADISDEFADSTLLLGNGTSRAIWAGFDYASLYEVAGEYQIAHRLSIEDIALFEAFGTTNFEGVLRRLAEGASTNAVLGLESALHQERHSHIRSALLDAVHAVHVPWDRVPDATLDRVADALINHRAVFTSSYDLLLYWSLMRRPDDLGDFFWRGCFDINDTEMHFDRRPVYYVHGALHLIRRADGRTCKLIRHDRNLLAQFLEDPDAEPLFVSEGTADDKLEAIRRSEYLTFAYDRLTRIEGKVVVFGHGLGQEDAHIAAAIRDPGLRIAVGIRAQTTEEFMARAGHYTNVLAGTQLTFFDATTHPLGDPALRVLP